MTFTGIVTALYLNIKERGVALKHDICMCVLQDKKVNSGCDSDPTWREFA